MLLAASKVTLLPALQRKIESAGDGISKPIILGELINDLKESKIIELPDRNYSASENLSNDADIEEISLLETDE